MSPGDNTAMNSGNENSAGDVPWELPDDLKSLEAGLNVLAPREDRLNRDRLVFLAGQASAVPTNQRPIALLGVSLDAQVWPRAFAAISVVAATLLVMLLMRPSSTGNLLPTAFNEVARGDRPPESRTELIGKSRETRPGMLSAGDVRGVDVERWLTTRHDDYVGAPAIDDRGGPTLTPAGWRREFDDAKSPGVPMDKSSHLLIDRGVKS